MSELVLGAPIVPEFDCLESLKYSLEAKKRFQSSDQYHRDGSNILGEVEARIGSLAAVDGGHVVSYTSGMSAVVGAIDTALDSIPSSVEWPTIACAQETYAQTSHYLGANICNKRAKVVYFDSGDEASISHLFKERQPDVVVAETVANSLNVPVLDTDKFLTIAGEADKQPVVVLDNTLPLSTALPLVEKIDQDDRVIVVESGTKSYTFNTKLLGIALTKNSLLHNALVNYRRTRGDIHDPHSLDYIASVLPSNRQEFDQRNRRLYQSTADIALALADGLEADSAAPLVSHPALPGHDNHDFYQQSYHSGATPVLYLQTPWSDQFNVTGRLWRHPSVREQAALGPSFGFDRARIIPDERARAIRIAGGAEIDGTALGQACAEALKNN